MLLSIASVLILGACKKEKVQDPEPETPVIPTEETTNGSLTIITQKYIGSSPIPDAIFATAFFYADIHSTNYIKVDSVIVNGVGLQYQSLVKLYQSPYNVIKDITKADWEVKGNNGIPSFTYSNKTGMPVYTGYTSIPDDISSSKDYTITLTGLSNTDLYIVSIRDGVGVQLSKNQLDAKNTSVTFTAAELATLDSDAIIQVTVVNHHFETFGGKQFSIQNEGNYYKDITIN